MRRIIPVLFLFSFAGCASTPLTEKAMGVRLVSTSPMNCEYLGRVYGSYRGDSVGVGIVGDVDSAAENDLLNNAGEMGADTVELIRSGGGKFSGEAYRCGNPKVKAASSN